MIQSLVVVAIIAAAVLYIGRRGLRMIASARHKSSGGGCGGGCGCGE